MDRYVLLWRMLFMWLNNFFFVVLKLVFKVNDVCGLRYFNLF